MRRTMNAMIASVRHRPSRRYALRIDTINTTPPITDVATTNALRRTTVLVYWGVFLPSAAGGRTDPAVYTREDSAEDAAEDA